MSSLYFRFAVRGDRAMASPLLDRLLARADDFYTVTDWRADAVRLDEPFAAAPLALSAAHGTVSGAWVCFATPVHYLAEMSNVRLARNGILRLKEATALALAEDFNRIWYGSGICMKVGRFADLFCIFDAPLQVTTHDADAVLERHIEEFLPTGADAARLRRLMSETEMWLFEHAATRGAATRGAATACEPTINGLWLWGGGEVRTSPLRRDLKFSGEDALFDYFQGDVSSGGIVAAPAPDSATWQIAERQWLEPAVAALRSGHLERLLLSGADRCYTVRAPSLRRFWRRERPWGEHFA